MAECAPAFARCAAQKRIPDAMAALALSSAADTSVREKCVALLAHWGGGGAADVDARGAFRTALEALRSEGVPLGEKGESEGAGGFAEWARAREAREAAARTHRRAHRRGGGGDAGAPRREEDALLPRGRDGRARGGASDDDDAQHGGGGGAASRARWNAAGGRARAGPEGDDRFRTGAAPRQPRQRARGDDTSSAASSASDDGGDSASGSGSDGGAQLRRRAQQQGSPRASQPRALPQPRPAGLPRGLSSDMREAVMMQEMLALDLRDEGEALLADGDLEGALALYTQALSYAPNYRLYAARAACLLRLGRADAAARDAAELVALLPSFHAGHGLLGQAHAARREFGRARAAFEKAIFRAGADGDDAQVEEYEAACARMRREEATHTGYD